MIPVNNAILHQPAIGRYGDCFSAALSSILEVSVPHVLHDGCESSVSRERLDEFLAPLCLAYFEAPVYVPAVMDALAWGEHFTRPHHIHYLLCGLTDRDVGHYVVCKADEIVHNPRAESVIVKPFEDGEFWLGVIARRT